QEASGWLHRRPLATQERWTRAPGRWFRLATRARPAPIGRAPWATRTPTWRTQLSTLESGGRKLHGRLRASCAYMTPPKKAQKCGFEITRAYRANYLERASTSRTVV